MYRRRCICSICNTNTVGDEEHYLLTCNNGELSRIREDFMKNIRMEIPQFETFPDKSIIDYCMLLHDPMIQMPVSVFVKNILGMYKEETEGITILEKPPVTTRAGRLSKRPIKLNL